MKSNELMLGNWVWFECDELHMTTSGRVIDIRSDGSYAPGVNINGGIIYRVGLIDQWGNQRDEHIIDLEPIPLTPERLEGMDFEELKNESWRCRKAPFHVITLLRMYDGYRPKGIRVVGWNPVKYVHSLQNLYFALTGEELVINPLI